MKIKLPVAAPVRYNPAFYLRDAFIGQGHEAEVIDQGELYNTALDEADLLVAVDSGGPLSIPEMFLPKSMMWYIDSRRNYKPEVRTPDDDSTAVRLLEHGGFVFQAQRRDVDRLQSKADVKHHRRIVWLPLAADPDVWSDQPPNNSPIHVGLVFVGNCFDHERHVILHTLMDEELLHWPGHEGAIMEDGAEVYRQASMGLNIPSWLGTPECYDVNMRVFEVLSCGRPLITNYLPELAQLGIREGHHVLTYPTPTGQQESGESARSVLGDVRELVERFMTDTEKLRGMGERARKLIISRHTYWHRAQSILFMFDSFMKGNQ